MKRKDPPKEWTVIPETQKKRVLEEEFPGATIRQSVLPPDDSSNTSTTSSSISAANEEEDVVTSLPSVISQTVGVACGLLEQRYRDVPEGGDLIAVIGPTASGKTSCSKELWRRSSMDPLPRPPQWDSEKAIVSQFGSPECAKRWLGRVGLNSIPSWTRPHHILSTGEKFRANLARRLQQAEETKSKYIIVDDFTSTLDRRTAACCSVSVAKEWRAVVKRRWQADEDEKNSPSLVVFTSHVDVLPWLQPNIVIQMAPTHCEIFFNVNYGSTPHVHTTVDLNECCMDVATQQRISTTSSSATSSSSSSSSATSSSSVAFHQWSPPPPCCKTATVNMSDGMLHAVRVTRCDGGAPAFMHDDNKEERPIGGVVLNTTVVRDHCTSMCDALFDSPFDGSNVIRVPDFPEEDLLCGGGGDDSGDSGDSGGSSQKKEWDVGYVTGEFLCALFACSVCS